MSLFEITLCLVIHTIFHVQITKILHDADLHLSNPIFTAVIQSCQIVIHRCRHISLVDRRDCHQVVRPCDQLPLSGLSQQMDCLRNVVEHVLHIIQQIVSFPTIKICKTKKCHILMFLCIPFYIKTAFECMLCVLSSAVQNFLFPCVYHVI